MRAVEAGARVTLNNILFLTDFSEPSETAIPYAIAIAREYEAKVHALHVLTPVRLSHATPESDAALIDGLEERAQVGMQRLDSQFVGVAHETLIVRGESVWSSVEKILSDREIDLVIVGTHGRTGAIKLLLGSVAEEIFRRASVPVLTIGPSVRTGAHSGGRFHRVLFATDFTPEAGAAAPYAISMAQENQARLLLLHVMRNPDPAAAEKNPQDSVANVMHELYEIVPQCGGALVPTASDRTIRKRSGPNSRSCQRTRRGFDRARRPRRGGTPRRGHASRTNDGAQSGGARCMSGLDGPRMKNT